MSRLQAAIDRIGPLDEAASAAAAEHLDRLTKPPGSLGRLEELAIQLAAITGEVAPTFDRRAIVVAAADHGVTAQGVSAYPSEVTAQMVGNFVAGGAAINVLARMARADVLVLDVGLDTASQLAEEGVRLVGLGEMGIGNTTAASSIVAALTGRPPSEVTGRGTGVDVATWRHKVAVIERGFEVNRPDPADALGVLAAVGGLEIAMLVGLALGVAAERIPVIVDGFVVGAAALVAARLCPALPLRLVAAHRSVEPGHTVVLDELGLRPLLELGLRLGEGTGAAIAMTLVDAAVHIRDEMATFESAGVAERTRI